MAKVYLRYPPYGRDSDWRTKPEYTGKFFFGIVENVHFIRSVEGRWSSFQGPNDDEIEAGWAIIEEDTEEA